MRRNTSLPVSAQECAASALMAADPDNTAANVLATAMTRFAPKATNTVRVLSLPAFTMRLLGAVVELAHPVLRHPASGTGYGLIDRMALWRSQFGAVVVLVGLV